YYEKNSRHATYNFSQEGQSLYSNQPRFPFEYYVDIKLNRVGTAGAFVQNFFNNPNWDQVQPLVKTIDMPSFKIQTDPINQYNRKRLSQTRINFEPVKMVFHDVADGKTLKLWEMYYRYYFGDGNEPGKNEAKQPVGQPGRITTDQFLKNITPSFNPNITGLPASIKKIFDSKQFSGKNSPTNQNGDKSAIQNIVTDTLDNHAFGFNLPTVQNIRNLIAQIDIYQVHGGRFNQVTLVNPRISAFTHDVLNYAESGKTLELTFTFEYEYAYYTIQNLKLGGGEENNNSTKEQFEHGEFLELPALAFNASLMNFIESNNPLLQSDNPILQRIGKNVQSSLGSVTGAFASKGVRRVTSSALNGLAQISPTPHNPVPIAKILTRPFASVPSANSSAYKDVNRVGGNPLG
ncbi:MAG TPA: hypothetical protein VIY47_15335, partial [Ignavibacteriaceae bacterium]